VLYFHPGRSIIIVFVFMLLLGHATNIVGTQQNTKYRSGPHWTISGEGKLAYTTYISESIGYVFKDYTRFLEL